MQTSLKRQRGLGVVGLAFVLAVIAFLAVIAIKVGPLYMNHMTILRVVGAVADDPAFANAEPGEIRKTLERRWDIDYISQIDDKDVKIVRGPRGRLLRVDYEARVNLFYNIFVVVQFEHDFQMRNSATPDGTF